VPNHAAYKAADVEDARRGHPAVDLAPYGRSRGLEPLGQAQVGHVAGLNPRWPDYVFNVLRGELVAGRFGTVQHELDEIALADDGEPTQGGSYFGRRSTARPGLRSLIGLRKEPPNEPFAAQALWMPTTGIKVLVPEAALLPRLVVRTADHAAFTEPSLVPGFRMVSSRWVGDDLRQAVGAAIGPTLQGLGTTFARLELAHGALGLRVDGFRADPADLDRLVAAVGAMAAMLGGLAAPWWAPGPFSDPLGAFDRSTHPAGYRSFDGDMDRSGMDAMARDAAAFGMVVEDPVALHRREPRLPLPGTSLGVLAGPLPGTTTFGRLTWQTQSHPGSSAYLRPAAVVEARPDAPALPVGGRLVADTDMYVALADGRAGCWTRTNSPGRLETADLATRAVATFRAAGVADL
jgi:hypothetical protein